MDAVEARACVVAINAHLNGARQLLLDLYEREGWRALGYASWRECVTVEFQQSQAHLYRQLEAAQLQRELAAQISPAGEILPSLAERHLRDIAELPARDRREVALAIARNGDLSIKDHRRIIAEKQREIVARQEDWQPPLDDRIPPNCQIEVGDARHLPLDDGVAHLWLASPPYNARLSYEGYEDWLPWDEYWHGLIEPSLREAYRVLAHGGRLALNMANVVRQNVPVPGHDGQPTQYQSRNHPWKWKPPGAGGDSWALMLAPRIWALLEEIGFLPREQLTWVKGSPSEDEDTTATPTSSTAWGTWCSAENPVLRAVAEPIFLASKGSHSRGAGPSDIEAAEFKRLTKNVWFVSALKPDSGHPAAFPVELPRRLIKLYSYPGDLIVDPFAGSGSTILAAASLGRWAYGCDISQRYVAIARARLAAEMSACD
jgi:modification methylase